ncbi:MAG: hypothetical protein II036_05880 [Oscillospiraceae bacterium]|nr:hypothetical protein [Oscillospiraceae bacterium]
MNKGDNEKRPAPSNDRVITVISVIGGIIGGSHLWYTIPDRNVFQLIGLCLAGMLVFLLFCVSCVVLAGPISQKEMPNKWFVLARAVGVGALLVYLGRTLFHR